MNMLKPEYQYLRDRICYRTLLCIFTSRSFLPFSLFFICTFHNKHVNGALLIDSHFYRAFFFFASNKYHCSRICASGFRILYPHFELPYLFFFLHLQTCATNKLSVPAKRKRIEKKKKEVKNGVILPTVRNRCTIRVRRLVLI